MLIFLEHHPGWTAIRADPRFQPRKSKVTLDTGDRHKVCRHLHNSKNEEKITGLTLFMPQTELLPPLLPLTEET